jgi:hypothetical protein
MGLGRRHVKTERAGVAAMQALLENKQKIYLTVIKRLK